MGLFSSFNFSKKPRKFSYIPRYYSPDLEKRQERERRILSQIQAEKDSSLQNFSASSIKGSFKRKKNTHSKINHKQNIKIVFIFLGLLLLTYLFLKYI